MSGRRCCGNIKLPKNLIKEGMENSCHNLAYKICEECGNYFCHNHINPEKHDCESLEKPSSLTGGENKNGN